MLTNNSLYGNFRQLKFSDVWKTAEEFSEDYGESGLAPATNKISESSCNVLYLLLYARYGNSVVASSDINQFKYQVYSTIFQFGPTWERKLEIQNNLRSLTDAELSVGDITINNHALNPGTAPTTEELDFVSDQNVIKAKKGNLNKYGTLLQLIEKDVTEEFLTKFKKFFLTIVQPENPLWYVSESEEENDD